MTSQARPTRQPIRALSYAQILTLVTGIMLTAVGIAGFFVTDSGSWDEFSHHATGDELLGFELNGVHNVVHIVLGVIGLIAWTRLRGALLYGLLLFVGYGAALVFGLFAVGEDWNFLSVNDADNWLHAALAVLGAAIAGIAVTEMRRPAPETIDLRDRAVIAETNQTQESLPAPNRVR